MWASFDFLMSGLLLFGLRWRDEKGGRQGSWMEPRFFFLGMGGGSSPHPSSPHLGEGNWGDPHLPTPPTQHPISAHTAEDALEGVYFASSSILRCLPYFLPKTRPRASYDLLEAFSSSCGRCGASVGRSGRPHPPLHTPRHPHLTTHR